MRIKPEFSGVNGILLGKFNPAIFTPAWFVLHDLLPSQAAENAQLKVVHPGITAFSTEWLNLQVTVDRFEAITQVEPYVKLRDFLLRVFQEQLYHTPLKAFGINRDVHFCVSGQVERDRIGRSLAPVEPWGPWKEKLGLDNEFGGMASLTMSLFGTEGKPPGSRVNVTIEPSYRVTDVRIGVYVRINDHYEIRSEEGDEIDRSAQLMGFLKDDFESSIQRSNSIIDHIMSLANYREGKSL